MYDNHIGTAKFGEIILIPKTTIDEIADRAYQCYEEGRFSDSQYDYLSSLIDNLQ